MLNPVFVNYQNTTSTLALPRSSLQVGILDDAARIYYDFWDVIHKSTESTNAFYL